MVLAASRISKPSGDFQTHVSGCHLENMNSFIGFTDPSETPTRGSGGHLKNKKCNGFIDSPGTPPRGSDGHLENLNVFLYYFIIQVLIFSNIHLLENIKRTSALCKINYI